MPKKTTKRTRKARPTTTSKTVMRVMRPELKKWNKISSGFLTQGALITWNLLHGLTQGLTTSTRIGGKINLRNFRVNIKFTNLTSLGSLQHKQAIRVLVFRGKYDYNVTSYPSQEVFEGNSGSVAPSLITAPIDTNQVTVLYDKVFHVQPTFSGQLISQVHRFVLPINKIATFREDDNYQQNGNYYIGFVNDNPADLAPNMEFQAISSYYDD